MPRRELPIPPPPENFKPGPYVVKAKRKSSFPAELRFQVRYDQNFICAICGKSCRGDHYNEQILNIHHIIPRSQGGTDDRENAIGLCPEPCHKLFDELALEQNIYIYEPTIYNQRMSLPHIRNSSESPARDDQEIQLGHRRLRKGKKVKRPEEKKRHQERIRRNPNPRPPYPPSPESRPPFPPSADVFSLHSLTAD